MNRAIIYTRVSTRQQAESGLGLGAQRDACARWADTNGFELTGLHADSGVSGSASVDKRPGLLAALSEIKRGDVFLVAKRDRLGRDPVLVAMIERMVERKGARVISAAGEGTESNDPSYILMRRMIDAFSEYEKLIIGARTKAALAKKRARGEKTGGSVPYGYRLASDRKSLEAKKAEQEVIDIMLDLRDEGLSFRAIANKLNLDGHRPRGAKWHATSVTRIIKRESSDARD